MNVLFLCLSYSTKDHKSFYEDLLQEFVIHGDKVYVACACEKSSKETPGLSEERGIPVLRIRTGNVTGNINIIEKGLSTLRIDSQFEEAVVKHYGDIKFDLIMYPTPPITLVNTVSVLKKRTGAKSYLLLKDIFPQNAVDLGMMTKSGLKGLIYKSFRRKEKKLYKASDFIGCMSPANVKYVLEHNSEVNPEKVEVCPNCIKEPVSPNFDDCDQSELRKKFGIPEDATIFIYGGNLGKPQGIEFFIECLDKAKDNKRAFFIIVGKGSEYGKLESFINEKKPTNICLLSYLPKEEYQEISDKADVGLILLDYRFTIPNFPSRLLAYMLSGIPTLVATDPNCDMGTIARDNGFGFCCESNDVEAFSQMVNEFVKADKKAMGKKAWDFYKENYTSERGWEIIMKHFN